MRTFICCILCFTSFTDPSVLADPAQNEKSGLTGFWQLVTTNNRVRSNLVFWFRDNEQIVVLSGVTGVAQTKGTWKANPDQEPAELDFVMDLSGLQLLGRRSIYRMLKNERLEICGSTGLSSGVERPAAFIGPRGEKKGFAGKALTHVLKRLPVKLVAKEQQLASRRTRQRLAGKWRVTSWQDTTSLFSQRGEVIWEFSPGGWVYRSVTVIKEDDTTEPKLVRHGRYRVAPGGRQIDLYVGDDYRRPMVGWCRLRGNSLQLELGSVSRLRPKGARGNRLPGDQGGKLTRIREKEAPHAQKIDVAGVR